MIEIELKNGCTEHTRTENYRFTDTPNGRKMAELADIKEAERAREVAEADAEYEAWRDDRSDMTNGEIEDYLDEREDEAFERGYRTAIRQAQARLEGLL